MKESLLKKKQLLRNNEYYSMQNSFDNLYYKSSNNKEFNNLMKYIVCDENIQLAYRNIKNNKGANTKGTDNRTIKDIEKINLEEYVKTIKQKFKNYHPKSVRRVEIPKPNGKTRPLGIPCIDDRIIQQCIKQVLEPICEAKFHHHSYGFRPNRSAHHAIARCMTLINKSNLHYVVDVDIKSFFDNVDHSKLKKQIWALGIHDKTVISIIGKMLKSEVEGIGVPTKGTPQGGILSPILSNIVLNELDWWISNQWETFKSSFTYKQNYNKYTALRKTNLKEMFIVRYADDFKIFCRDYKTAQKIYNATRQWLKERLSLDISPDKSKVTNLRKNYTEFLGIKLTAKPKRNTYVCSSRMTNKAIAKSINNIKKQIKIIQKNPTYIEVNKLNSIILGMHNYYNMATNITLDMHKIHFLVNRALYNRLRHNMSSKHNITKTYKELYGGYNCKKQTIDGITIFPIHGCKTKPPMNFSQQVCNYTESGREMIHDKLIGYSKIVQYLLNVTNGNDTVQLSDNKISLYIGQKGKCTVTKELLIIGEMECHHKIPRSLGGSNEYKNLVWVNKDVHKLIHATNSEIIQKYKQKLNLKSEAIRKVNSLRKLVGNSCI